MAISIPSGLTDDNDFVDLLNALLNALLVQQTPEQLWVIQIDNWFDHKWLRYSGSGSVAAKFPADWTSSFMGLSFAYWQMTGKWNLLPMLITGNTEV